MIWREGLVLVLAGKGFLGDGGNLNVLAGASYFWRELACPTLAIASIDVLSLVLPPSSAFLPNEKSGNYSLHYRREWIDDDE